MITFPSFFVISNASYIFGNTWFLLLNTMSITGPIIWDIFPLLLDILI
jgi:hypothetical protein